MDALPSLPFVPVLPQLPGATGAPAPVAAATAPSPAPDAEPDPAPISGTPVPPPANDFPKIEHTHPLTLREFPAPSNVDPQIWQDEREIPPQPARQDPDYELGWMGRTSLPAAPTGPARSLPAATADTRAAIVNAAHDAGMDPVYGLATADRESSLNPDAGGTGSIAGLFQMSGGLRRQYGIAPGSDAYGQARGFFDFTRDLQGEMYRTLGRTPTPAETYMGHYFGGTRAARMIGGAIAPDTPVEDVFTPRELAGNPNIRRAGTVGNLMNDVTTDMNRRLKRYAGEGQTVDFSRFGQGDGEAVDLKVNNDGEGLAANFARNQAWTKKGAKDFNTDLGEQEPAFRKWVADNRVPFDPDAKGPNDYDMRGFWRALQAGDAKAKSAIDPNDKQLHYPDYWKTPYHETFSNESQWAAPNAPKWNDKDQLIGPDGDVLFDDRARNPPPRPGAEVDLTQYGV